MRVFCNECGDEIGVISVDLSANVDLEIIVEDCEKCLDNAREEADNEGYKRGYDEGYEDGKKEIE